MTEEEFDAFYAASFPAIVRQLYAMCGSGCDAHDCVQEAFVRAWDHRDKLSKSGSPEAWVRTVAYRIAVSSWRKFGRRSAPITTDFAGGTEPGPDSVALRAALETLPANHRRAIVLFYLADLSVADVAHEMGVAQGTVKSWLSRGRVALATTLSAEERKENL